MHTTLGHCYVLLKKKGKTRMSRIITERYSSALWTAESQHINIMTISLSVLHCPGYRRMLSHGTRSLTGNNDRPHTSAGRVGVGDKS